MLFRSEMVDIQTKLKKVFGEVTFFVVPVPLYVGSFMTLSFASNFNPKDITQTDIVSAFNKTNISGLKYYNPEVHFGSFLLPNYIKNALS